MAGMGAFWFAHIADGTEVNGGFGQTAGFAGEPGGDAGGFFDRAVGYFFLLVIDDDMGAGGVFDMEPEMVFGGLTQGEAVVLDIVATDCDQQPVRGQIAPGGQGLIGRVCPLFFLFGLLRVVRFLFARFAGVEI